MYTSFLSVVARATSCAQFCAPSVADVVLSLSWHSWSLTLSWCMFVRVTRAAKRRLCKLCDGETTRQLFSSCGTCVLRRRSSHTHKVQACYLLSWSSLLTLQHPLHGVQLAAHLSASGGHVMYWLTRVCFWDRNLVHLWGGRDVTQHRACLDFAPPFGYLKMGHILGPLSRTRSRLLAPYKGPLRQRRSMGWRLPNHHCMVLVAVQYQHIRSTITLQLQYYSNTVAVKLHCIKKVI
jgi:hypothetical protein